MNDRYDEIHSLSHQVIFVLKLVAVTYGSDLSDRVSALIIFVDGRPVGRGGCDGCARTPLQTAEVHFFVKQINSKRKK